MVMKRQHWYLPAFICIIIEILRVVAINWKHGIAGVNFFLDPARIPYPGSAGDYWYSLYISGFFEHFSLPPNDARWVFNIWPIGMPLYYAVLSWMALTTSATPLIHVLVMVVGWMVLLWLPLRNILSKSAKYAALILVLVVLISGPLFDWILGYGIFYAEGLSILLMLLGIYLIYRQSPDAVRKNRPRILFLAGIILALAGLVKTSIEFAIEMTFICLLLYYLIRTLYTRSLNYQVNLRSKNRRIHSQRRKTRQSKTFRYVLLGYILIALPIHLAVYSHNHGVTYTDGGGQTWRNAWTTSATYESSGSGIFVNYGINGACVSYPETCQVINENGISTYSDDKLKNIALNLITKNPLPFLRNRFDVINMNVLKNMGSRFLPNYSGLLSVVISISILLLQHRRKVLNKYKQQTLFLIYLVIFWLIAPLYFSSIEPRYFYPSILLLNFGSLLALENSKDTKI